MHELSSATTVAAGYWEFTSKLSFRRSSREGDSARPPVKSRMLVRTTILAADSLLQLSLLVKRHSIYQFLLQWLVGRNPGEVPACDRVFAQVKGTRYYVNWSGAFQPFFEREAISRSRPAWRLK